MIAGMLGSYTGTIINRFLNSYELRTKESTLANLLSFCDRICGERVYIFIVKAIENYLAEHLDFERATILSYDHDTLYALKYDQYYIEENTFIEIPSDIGLTGRCIKTLKTIISSYGKNDTSYDSQADNVLKLYKMDNIVIVPLVPEYGDTLNTTKGQLVGVLHLINYKGDITQFHAVFLFSKK